MGLDWCLKDKVKPGDEKEAAALRGKLDELSDDQNDKDYKLARSRLAEISISPAETLGAPRIGIDEKATEWLRQQQKSAKAEIKKSGKNCNPGFKDYWSRPFKDVLKDEHGKYVIALAGYDASTVTGIISSALDFRGKCVGRCDLLPEALASEAYEDHGPDKMIPYAERLEAAVAKILKMSTEEVKAKAKALEDDERKAVEGKEGAAYYEALNKWHDDLSKKDRQVYELSVVLEGANWLRFWGERGHGYWAWY